MRTAAPRPTGGGTHAAADGAEEEAVVEDGGGGGARSTAEGGGGGQQADARWVGEERRSPTGRVLHDCERGNGVIDLPLGQQCWALGGVGAFRE